MKKNILMALFTVAIMASFAPMFAMDDECYGDECYNDVVYMGDEGNDDYTDEYDDYY